MRREFHVRFCEGAGGQFPRATRLLIGFEQMEDAQRVMEVLPKRMGKHGLTLHPDKTRLVRFERPRQSVSKGPGTFDFLGFTLYWKKTLRGGWRVWCKTRTARLRRAIRNVYLLCRRKRHGPVKDQQTGLNKRLVGHYNYFGVNGNWQSLMKLLLHTQRAWFKWLRRRGQRRPLSWKRFEGILKAFPLARPRIAVQIWT